MDTKVLDNVVEKLLDKEEYDLATEILSSYIAGGFSLTPSNVFLSLVPKKNAQIGDVFFDRVWIPVKDDDGKETHDHAHIVSIDKSPILSSLQEKQGMKREYVVTIEIQKGYEDKITKAVQKEYGKDWEVTKLPKFRNAQTVGKDDYSAMSQVVVSEEKTLTAIDKVGKKAKSQVINSVIAALIRKKDFDTAVDVMAITEENEPVEIEIDKRKQDVIKFFKDNPNPTDKQVHDFAKSKGFDVSETEQTIYGLATKFINLITGGRSNEKHLTEENVDPDQLARGIEVEKEHTEDEDVAKKIAMDHLAEFPNYYAALDKMESELELAQKEKTSTP